MLVVQRHGEILNGRGATDQSRVKDRSFECPDPKYTPLQICFGAGVETNYGMLDSSLTDVIATLGS